MSEEAKKTDEADFGFARVRILLFPKTAKAVFSSLNKCQKAFVERRSVAKTDEALVSASSAQRPFL